MIDSSRRGFADRRTLLSALAVAIFFQAIVTVATEFLPSSPNGDYGAPIPVGQSGFAYLVARPSTFEWLLFGLDVLIMWGVFLLLARWSGLIASVVGGLVAPFAVVLIFLMAGARLPFYGLPIPILESEPLPTFLVIWADMLIWSIGAAMAAHALRGNLAPA